MICLLFSIKKHEALVQQYDLSELILCFIISNAPHTFKSFFIVVLEKHLPLTDVHQEHSTYTQGKAPWVIVR